MIAAVRKENGSGSASPGWRSSTSQSIVAPVEPRRRAGLEPAEGEACAEQARGKLLRRRLADPAGRNALGADMDHAAQKSAGGQHQGAGRQVAPVGQDEPGDPAASVRISAASPSMT